MASQNGSAQDGTDPVAVQQPPPAPPAAWRAAGLRAAGRPPRCVGCQVCGASLEGAKSRFYKVSKDRGVRESEPGQGPAARAQQAVPLYNPYRLAT